MKCELYLNKTVIIMNTIRYHWETLSHVYGLSIPHKNGPWAWNTSLPRDKEPTQPALGLTPFEGLSFPVSGSMCTPVFCLSMCVNDLTPLVFSISHSTGVSVLPLWHKRANWHVGPLPCIGC